MNRTLLGVAGSVVALALISCAPQNSPDVRVIGDNVVNMPSGGQTGFSQYQTTTSVFRTWAFTYNAKTGDVHMDCEPLCTDTAVMLDTVDKPITIGTNTTDGDIYGKFVVTKKSDGSVDISWPKGITLSGH